MANTRAALAHTFSSPRRLARACAVLSAFAWFWTGAIAFAWLVLPIAALAGARAGRLRRCQAVLGRAFSLFHEYMRLLGLFNRRFSKAPSNANRPAAVLVANHTTLVDVTSIMSEMPHVCCLANPKYVENPLFGRLLRICGFISAGRDLRGRAEAFRIAEARLREGFDILIFPEGTRSPPGGILPFHRGAFELACRANVPIVPLMLHCEPSALTKDRPFFSQPDTMAELTIDISEPFIPEAFARDGATLKEAVFSHYRSFIEHNRTRRTDSS